MGWFSKKKDRQLKTPSKKDEVVPAEEAIKDIQEVTDPEAVKTVTEAVQSKEAEKPVEPTEADKEAAKDPLEAVQKLSLAEADRWGRLDAEIRNVLQGQRILTLEIQVAETQEQHRRIVFKNQQATRHQEINALQGKVASLRAEYQGFTKELARKYQVELTKLVIDPDTRVIREID